MFQWTFVILTVALAAGILALSGAGLLSVEIASMFIAVFTVVFIIVATAHAFRKTLPEDHKARAQFNGHH